MLAGLKTRFEQILTRSVEADSAIPPGRLRLSGISAPSSLAFLASQFQEALHSDWTHVFVLPTDEAAQEFTSTLALFGTPSASAPLLSFDTTPYSGLHPNPQLCAERIGWLARGLNAMPGEFFVASVQGLFQKCLPPRALSLRILRWKKTTKIPSQIEPALVALGYQLVPQVDDVGQFSLRGGILDVFSPAERAPVRMELFGDQIETLRFFSAESQRSLGEAPEILICPTRDVFLDTADAETVVTRAKSSLQDNPEALEQIVPALARGRYFVGSEYFTPFFFDETACPSDFLPKNTLFWTLPHIECVTQLDELRKTLLDESESYRNSPLWISPLQTHEFDLTALNKKARVVEISSVRIESDFPEEASPSEISYSVSHADEFQNLIKKHRLVNDSFLVEASDRLKKMKANGLSVFLCCPSVSQAKRLAFLFEKHGLQSRLLDAPPYIWQEIISQQMENSGLLHLLVLPLPESSKIDEEGLVFLQGGDFFSRRERRSDSLESQTAIRSSLELTDISAGDHIVHIQHGVGLFEGLRVMNVQGVDSEFLQLVYRDGDKLYLPIYRIAQVQKFSGVPVLDKLGSGNWQKTKIKVRSHLRDLASELLALYAKRAHTTRPSFDEIDDDFRLFETLFPYDETPDQLRAIEAVLGDFKKAHPMDRLICGDVGFGKTEVALRAAFRVVQSGGQVAVIAPTTVLAFQHLETFRRRFQKFSVNLAGLSRFTSRTEMQKAIGGLKDGSVHIAIGTHRLLSKDVEFKNLGLLIVDEEQKFGVSHKERIKKIRVGVDTLTLSATPIPRTLNMSLLGIRDLSLIMSPPRNRLPIRTFVSKFNAELVRKAMLSEIHRGGQVFYVHNRVQSISALHEELTSLVPEARIRIAHGQMEEGLLEDTMVSFVKHEFDVLLCTTIIESGMDIPLANTMIVDRADTFGLSQLYQLRGRIGRSKERAYCYLFLPSTGRIDADAQERLKILQENSELGSGIRIAQHDLELRGAGNLLGEEQSGHINAVGYELYLELLEDALKTARGEDPDDHEVEPDLNLRIPALIPDTYMPDIRMRLSFYKRLTSIRVPTDLDDIEDDLRDQFGPLPDQVTNLLGLMLIRRACKDLGIRDISSGTKSVSLSFTEKTKVPPQVIIGLVQREKMKYSLTPDSRVLVKMEPLTWPAVYEELEKIRRLAD